MIDCQDSKTVLESLVSAARVASVMVDGDKAMRIVTPRALHYLTNPDLEFRYLSGDFYDVDHDRFLDMKKTLLRLERLVPFTCSSALWIRVADPENRLALVVQNGNIHRYYTFGTETMACEPELEACLENRQVTTAPVPHATHTLTALAPVFDSLGDAVAVVELSAMDPSSKVLPPAWN